MLIGFFSLFFFCFGISAGQTTTHITVDKGKCGTRIQDDDPERVRVITTIAGRVPWHVGIYKFNTSSNINDLICGGVISTPDIVLTAASCVYDTITRKPFKPDLLRIIAGKLAFDWSSTDTNAQEMTVQEIAVSDKFLSNVNANANNVAMLQLTADLRYTDLVLPVCFDLNTNVYNIQNRYLQTAGWGFVGGVSKWPYLKEANLQYMTSTECAKKFSPEAELRFIKYDKICLLIPGGRTNYDTGGGVVYKKDNKYHLVGIMSDYINNEFFPVTNLSGHLTWINNTIELFGRLKRCKNRFLCHDGTCIEESMICDGVKDCPDGTDENQETCPSTIPKYNLKYSCLLPTQPGGESYTKQFCNSFCDLKSNTNIAQNVQVKLSCGKGFIPTGLNAVYICSQGRWFPDVPKCIKLCSPLKEPNVIFHCVYEGKAVNCNTFMKQGTIATYRCIEQYRLVGSSKLGDNLICTEGGVWKNPLPKCSPNCGIENPADSVELTVANGNVTKYGKYPWHVGIFTYLNDTYENICGGTLISENMVLTAAHCLVSPEDKKYEVYELMVAAGKFYRTWETQEKYQQTSRVRSILFLENYVGSYTQYEQDIALINTEKSFIFSDFVLPTCIDYSQSLNLLQSNTIGTMVGWGLTEEEQYSEELREIRLPIINAVDCRKKFGDYKLFVNWDKFCALFINGSGLLTGDIGGGMTIKQRGLHFIYGVISKDFGENQTVFTTLTNVSAHFDWIRHNLNRYTRQRKL